jgi:8-oxo-dGTP diphosphatase
MDTGPGETDAACAIREVGEEAGIAVGPGGLDWRAELCFVFPSRPELDAVVTVFFGREWSGEPRESEEMAPEWFDDLAGSRNSATCAPAP